MRKQAQRDRLTHPKATQKPVMRLGHVPEKQAPSLFSHFFLCVAGDGVNPGPVRAGKGSALSHTHLQPRPCLFLGTYGFPKTVTWGPCWGLLGAAHFSGLMELVYLWRKNHPRPRRLMSSASPLALCAALSPWPPACVLGVSNSGSSPLERHSPLCCRLAWGSGTASVTARIPGSCCCCVYHLGNQWLALAPRLRPWPGGDLGRGPLLHALSWLVAKLEQRLLFRSKVY